MDDALGIEGRKNMKKLSRKIPPIAWLLIPCLLCICLLVYSINFRMSAQATGGMIGTSNGELVGRAIGSLDGLMRGEIEGYQAGKAEGLRATDTVAAISNSFVEVGKLEVLVASGTYIDVLTIGQNQVNYAALLSQKYNAVFTIDLNTASIELEDDVLHVQLDQPIVEFIPVGLIEKKNEFKRKDWLGRDGSTEDGYIATDNSMNEICQKAQGRLQSNEALLAAARGSAETQLTQLVNAVSLSKLQIRVRFRGGTGNA